MADSPTACRRCGATILPESPGGICAACLLQAGWDAVTQSPLKIRCPHCQNPLEIVDDQPVRDITCPSCDTHFSLLGDATGLQPVEHPGSIGRFKILERLGEGAFGSVWKGHDPELDRLVAIKVPRQGPLDPEQAEKFLREARSAAQLRHPRIVPVHEVGRSGDRLYIVSDFIAGETLADVVQHQRLTPHESAQLCEAVADALHHAHQAGVIHRDVKPSNILVDSSGIPHVTDFGLAKRDAAEITMTLDGQILGSPAYMSPEQARGDAHQADARSDVYALGVVLYELLTGEKPFRGTTRMLLQQVLHDPPPQPRRLNSLIPRDLETICLKCLEKEPAQRYQTAALLAGDLLRFREGRPISARPVGRPEQLRRWCTRNPLTATLAGGLTLAITLGLLGVLWQWRNAVLERRRAEASTMQYQDELVKLTTANGSFALQQGAPLRALSWYARGLTLSPGDSPQAELNRRRIGAITRQLPRLERIFAEGERLGGAVFSPRGIEIATWGDQGVSFWNSSTGALQGEPFQGIAQIQQAVFSTDGRWLAVVGRNNEDPWQSPGELAILDAATGRPQFAPRSIPALQPGGIAFVNAGQTLAVASDETLLRIDCETGEYQATPLPGGSAFSMEATADGRRVLVCSGYYEMECTIQVIDAATGELQGEPVNPVEVWSSGRHASPDGRTFATWAYDPSGGRASGPSTLQLWNLETGKRLFPPFPTETNVSSVVFPRTRPLVLAHLRNQGLVAWNHTTGEAVPLHPLLREGCRRFAFSPDESRLAVERIAGGSTEVVIVDPWNPQEPYQRLEQPGGRLHWSPDGQQLVIDDTSNWRCIDLGSRESRGQEASSRRGDEVVEFSPLGDTLLTISPGGAARLWNMSDVGPRSRSLAAPPGEDPTRIVLSPTGDLLAIGGGPNATAASRTNVATHGWLRAWDWRTGSPAGPEVQFPTQVTEIRFGSDDRMAVVVTEAGTAVVLDPTTGAIRGNVGDPQQPVASAALSPSGELVVYRAGIAPHARGYAPSFDRTSARLEVWKLTSEPELSRTISLEPHQVFALADDGDHFFIGHERLALVGVVRTGASSEVQELDSAPRSASFNREGSRLVIVSDSALAKVWDARTGQVIASAWEDLDQARLGKDDRFLLTMQDARCQIWDAATAEPVSLPVRLQRPGGPSNEAFLATLDPAGDHLLVVCGSRIFIWDLTPDARPAAQIVAAVRAASGHGIDARGGYSPIRAPRTQSAGSEQHTATAAAAIEQDQRADWHHEAAERAEWALSEAHRRGIAERQGLWYSVAWHLRRLPEESQSQPSWNYQLGRALVELADFPNGLKHLSAALEGNASAPAEWWLMRGRSLAALGRIAEAEEDAARAMELGLATPVSQADWPTWVRRGFVRGLGRQLAQSPGDLSLVAQRARLSWELAEWPTALADFERLLAEGPVDQRLQYQAQRGDCLTGLGQLDAAVLAYSAALDGRLDDPLLLDSRAGVRALQGEIAEALADLEQAKSLWSNPYEPTISAAFVHLLAGDQTSFARELSAAVVPLKSAMGSHWATHLPDEVARDLAWLAALGPATERLAEFQTMAEALVQRSPQDLRGRLALGGLLLAHGDLETAQATLTNAVSAAPEAVEGALWMALTCQARGDLAEFSRWRQRSVELQPPGSLAGRFPWRTAAGIRILENRMARTAAGER